MNIEPVKLELVSDIDEPDAGQIFIDVNFDGNNVKCFFDTGAKSTKIVNNDFFAAYKTAEDGSLAGLAGKSITTDKIQVNDISIGQTKLGGHKIMRIDKKHTIVPTVGIDLFQEKSLEFNFKQKEFKIKNSIILEAPFEIGKMGHILLSVEASEIPLRMIWDTGAGLTTIDQKLIDANPNLFKFIKGIDVGDTVSTKPMQLKLYEVNYFKVGNITLSKVKVIGADFSPMQTIIGDKKIVGAIGYNFVTHFNWAFDMKQKRFNVK